jgi:tetratricopeptide (TPR) repeat protein
MLDKTHNGGQSRHPTQIAKVLGLVVLLIFLIWSAGRAGFASLLTKYAAGTNQLAAADAAVSLNSSDPEAHQIRGAILEGGEDPRAALSEYTKAVTLRPEDYVLWLSLAHARELNSDLSGAVVAASEAVRLAPFYAEPHWQLGNILARAGRQAEGFSELRLAGASNPALLPAITDLAWQLSHGNAETVTKAIQPNTPEAYLALAEYLKKRGLWKETVALFRSAGSFTEEYRRRFIDELIAAKRFEDAYQLWSINHPPDPDAPNVAVARGFEVETDLDEAGFGWRAKKVPAVELSLDNVNAKEGKSSLRIEFKGESDPGAPIITQLVMVYRSGKTQLHFAARTEAIVSGGLPRVMVLDAVNGQTLGQSEVFPLTSNGWRDYTIDFTVPEKTPTIQIVLQRERCSRSPCPIFGRLWLDNFWLT